MHVFTTGLKEGGLEIFSELHIFLAGKIMVEKRRVVGERERISFLPKEAFRAISIDKVRVEGARVNVEFNMPTADDRRPEPHADQNLRFFCRGTRSANGSAPSF